MKTLCWSVVLGSTLALAAPGRASDITSAGQKLDDALVSMDVEHLWLPHHIVSWKTGAVLPKPVTDRKAHTHCSAFVAAACMRLGVYILRPPQHSSTLLANAQYDWLRSEGAANGWLPVEGTQQAQQLANKGYLVVATFKESNPTKSGHIALVRPSTKTDAAIREAGPDLMQAGLDNASRTNLRDGFRHHRDAPGRILFFSHAVE